jgi:hypothetical protein
MEKKIFRLVHEESRRRAIRAIVDAPDGWKVTVQEDNRTLDQNAKFHAICTDIARSKHPWMGKPRTADAWKVLLVSGHAVATQEEAEVVPGLEGEFVNIRESTALMGKKRGASLIEYAIAFCANHEIPTQEVEFA